MLDPQGQLAAQGIVGYPGRESLPVFDQQIQQQGGIVGIILGAAAGKRFAVAGQRFGINRVEPQKVVVHQGRDHGPPALLQGDGHQALRETLPQLRPPRPAVPRGVAAPPPFAPERNRRLASRGHVVDRPSLNRHRPGFRLSIGTEDVVMSITSQQIFPHACQERAQSL